MMQDFDLESLTTVGDHSQKVNAPKVVSDYGNQMIAHIYFEKLEGCE